MDFIEKQIGNCYNKPMHKLTKKQQKQEDLFQDQISPLLDKITDICDKNGMSLLVAVQLFTHRQTGARVAAQSVETSDVSIPLLLASNILRGTIKITANTDNTYNLSIPVEDDSINILDFTKYDLSADEFDGAMPILPQRKMGLH